MVRRKIALSIVAVTAVLVVPGVPRAQQPTGPKAGNPTTITIDDKSIGGTVTSRFGPEAGVWIIAETRDLGTRFAKIVVTDERGRYVIPDLPKASYRVWVRGYGLVDSEKVPAQLGKPLDLTAVEAVRALEPYCGEFLYTHVDAEGLLGGTNFEAIMAVNRKIRLLCGLAPTEHLKESLPGGD